MTVWGLYAFLGHLPSQSRSPPLPALHCKILLAQSLLHLALSLCTLPLSTQPQICLPRKDWSVTDILTKNSFAWHVGACPCALLWGWVLYSSVLWCIFAGTLDTLTARWLFLRLIALLTKRFDLVRSDLRLGCGFSGREIMQN